MKHLRLYKVRFQTSLFIHPQDSSGENNGTFLNKYLIWRELKMVLLFSRIYVKNTQCFPFLCILAHDNRATAFSNPSLADGARPITFPLSLLEIHIFHSGITNVIRINDDLNNIDLYFHEIVNFTLQIYFFILDIDIQLKHRGIKRIRKYIC